MATAEQLLAFQKEAYFDLEWGLPPFSWLEGVRFTPGGKPYFLR